MKAHYGRQISTEFNSSLEEEELGISDVVSLAMDEADDGIHDRAKEAGSWVQKNRENLMQRVFGTQSS